MRNILLLFTCCFCWTEAGAQATFNKRMRFDYLAASLTSIVPTDSCYYATGIVADTVLPYNTGNIFLKIGLDGEPLWAKTLTSTEKTYETWENTLVPVGDGFLLSGYTIDSTMKALLIRYNDEGDTLWTREYFSIYYPEQAFFRPMDLAVTSEGVYMCNWLGTPILGNSDISIMKLDATGEVLWEETYGTANRERPESMVVTPGGVISGAVLNNTNFTAAGYEYKAYITSHDSLGNWEWHYFSPAGVLRDAANDMLLLDDGSLIVASGVGHEQERPSVNVVYFEKYIFKLNPQHELEWELTFPDPELSGNSYTSALLELSDGSGYIMTGREHEPSPFPGVGYTVRGWLGKVSPVGDSVWTRQYAYITDSSNRHYLHDIKEASDGGLIICGEAREDGSQAEYPQQAWLLKLDEHGCLVPGCHLLDNTDEETAPELSLAIYPNPTSDYLNFQLRGADLTGFRNLSGLFRIIDAQGRTVKEFAAGGRDDTYIIPVWDWVAGVYFLQYWEDGVVVVNEKFIKN